MNNNLKYINTMNQLLVIKNYLFTISFNDFPALKTGAFEAGIIISSLVCGFLPFLLDNLDTLIQQKQLFQ